ncbi:DUF4062 domain-containing protein [Lachnospiraceae bacterium 46-15]
MEKRYQVFISSTFADLEMERKDIMEAIMELNCFPAGMEMFPATDTEQFEYIKSIIDESDYYVVVIAGRYGSVAEDGISYTEKEFDYAVSKGIPVLAFVKKDIESLPMCRVEQESTKRKKLDRFRKKALNGRVARFWNNSDELKYVIHSSLSKEFKTHPKTGWIKANEPVCCSKESILGRETEISQTKIEQTIFVLKQEIEIPVECPEGIYNMMPTTMEEFLLFVGTDLIVPCTDSDFIRLVNNFVEYVYSSSLDYSENGAVMPSGLSKIKTLLYSYEIININISNAVGYYAYTALGKEIIKHIGKKI